MPAIRNYTIVKESEKAFLVQIPYTANNTKQIFEVWIPKYVLKDDIPVWFIKMIVKKNKKLKETITDEIINSLIVKKIKYENINLVR